jgi:hypothetical protein
MKNLVQSSNVRLLRWQDIIHASDFCVMETCSLIGKCKFWGGTECIPGSTTRLSGDVLSQQGDHNMKIYCWHENQSRTYNNPNTHKGLRQMRHDNIRTDMAFNHYFIFALNMGKINTNHHLKIYFLVTKYVL